jgi:hypothetical protein
VLRRFGLIKLEIEDDLASTVDAALRARLDTLRYTIENSKGALRVARQKRISQLENLIFELRRVQAAAELNTKEKHG